MGTGREAGTGRRDDLYRIEGTLGDGYRAFPVNFATMVYIPTSRSSRPLPVFFSSRLQQTPTPRMQRRQMLVQPHAHNPRVVMPQAKRRSNAPSTPRTQSPGILMYESMAALNAAKPAQPTRAACGPAFAPSMPPVMHPAAMPFVRSFFARYCSLIYQRLSPHSSFQKRHRGMIITPSMQHSVPANMAPINPKFFAEL